MTDRLANAQERAIKMMENTFKMCYQEGFDDCYKKVEEEQLNAVTTKEEVAKMEYERGLNDAWECARKLWSMSPYERAEIFHDKNCMLEHTASKAIQMIKEYEEKKETQKIKVGDIVTVGQDTNEFIVTWVGTDEVTLISRSGFHARTARIDCLVKTGEHCDIEKCFKCKVF